MRRLPQTLADYVIVAISPILIMLLIGSLVYFLLEVFYQGEYQARLQYVFALFVMATVLIGRISIEEGAAYASMFAAPMAIVTGLAMMRFVEFQADVSPAVHLLINLGLMGLVWFAAHQLTWDCTVVDDSLDGSGAGLLDRPNWGRTTADEPAQRTWWMWLQSWVQRPREAHAMGRWVVYFGAATLPLFGIGQWFVPASEVASRRYIFALLCIYLFSALGLLLTTSFLSLRRYLRQRQMEMPAKMTSAWLVAGGALVVATIAIAAMIPRPAAEYEVAKLPVVFGSPGQKHTSRYAQGNDGIEDKQQEHSKLKPGDKQAERTVSSQEGDAADPQGREQNGEQSNQQQSEDRSDQQSQQHSGEQSKQPSDKPGEGEAPSSSQQQPQQSTDNNKDAEQAQSQQTQQEQSSSASSQQTSSTPRSPSLPQLPSNPLELLPWLRWVVYALLAIVIAALVWWHREQIAAAWRQFLQELWAAWQRLLGRYADATREGSEQAATGKRSRKLSDYPNPFATGLAARTDAATLIHYSFAALEAWGNEHNCPRNESQTPLEFALQVGRAAPALAREAQRLAEMYSLVAYSSAEFPRRSNEQLRPLWQLLERGQYDDPVARPS